MQTYSHYILTALLHRKLKQQTITSDAGVPVLQVGGLSLPPIKSPALMLGSIAPDIPLILLTIVFIISDRMAGRSFGPNSPEPSNVGYLFDYLFFHNKWVMTLHNLFHGPIMVIFYLIAGYWGWRLGRKWGPALFWFAFACALHTAIDIPLHTDDGPLLLFPFYFGLRYRSPLSYWDPAHYGNLWAPVEHLAILGTLIYLIWDWWQTRRTRLRSAS